MGVLDFIHQGRLSYMLLNREVDIDCVSRFISVPGEMCIYTIGAVVLRL